MMTQFRRKTTAVVAALALAALAAVPVSLRAASPASSPLSMPVTGTAPGGASFSGVFALTSFAVQNGQVVALGTVSGILKTAAGATTTSVSNVAVPVSVGQTTCQILHLDLGPLFLDILGLQVSLSQVVLDITAQSGAGNLLGNLLCAVAGLLDNPGGLARLLNQILGILTGI